MHARFENNQSRVSPNYIHSMDAAAMNSQPKSLREADEQHFPVKNRDKRRLRRERKGWKT